MEIRGFRLLNTEFRKSLPISFSFPHFLFTIPFHHITHMNRMTKHRHDIFINPNNGKRVTEKFHSLNKQWLNSALTQQIIKEKLGILEHFPHQFLLLFGFF